MEDHEIIKLFQERNDRAVAAVSEKYGGYCMAIARNILGSEEDAEECVNDTYLKAWNSIPPHCPERLSAFLGKITRSISFNKYKYNHAEKRGGGEIAPVLDELEECVSNGDSVERAFERGELIKAINSFVRALPAEKQSIFIRRYWYADTVKAISEAHAVSCGSVTKTLERIRKKLKKYLTERGFEL